MSDKLSGAYEEALMKLNRTNGPQVAIVVRSVIEAKNSMAEFEQALERLAIEQWVRDDLVTHLADRISSDIAAMCSLVGKGFKNEILPLVQKVVEDARQSKKLQ